MQNKANFLKAEIDGNLVFTKDYENLWLYKSLKNKPNSNPIKPNTNPIQSQFKSKKAITNPIKPNTNPIAFSGAILELPRTFIPDEKEILLKFSAHPLMRADIEGSVAFVAPVLIGDCIHTNLVQKGF